MFHYFVVFTLLIVPHNVGESYWIDIEECSKFFFLQHHRPLYMPSTSSCTRRWNFFSYWLLIAPCDGFFIQHSLHFSCQKFVWIVCEIKFHVWIDKQTRRDDFLFLRFCWLSRKILNVTLVSCSHTFKLSVARRSDFS